MSWVTWLEAVKWKVKRTRAHSFAGSEFFPRAFSHDQWSIFRFDCYLLVQHDTAKSLLQHLFSWRSLWSDHNRGESAFELRWSHANSKRDKLECEEWWRIEDSIQERWGYFRQLATSRFVSRCLKMCPSSFRYNAQEARNQNTMEDGSQSQEVQF